MIIFHKKKLFLKNYYNDIFLNNSVVLFCHLNDIKLLPIIREDLYKYELNVKVLKNNMAKKLLFNSIFMGSTLCIYGNKVNMYLFRQYLTKKNDAFIMLLGKIDNYLVKSNDLSMLLLKCNLKNTVMLNVIASALSKNSFLLLNYLIKIYFILFRVCQR